MKKTFIIAEAGVNHNGSLKTALEMVDAAAESGADAVKFQTFKTGALTTRWAGKAKYQGKSGTQYEMLSRLELREKDFREIFQRCRSKDIEFISTPFDPESLDFLLTLGVKRLKIGSGDLTNSPLLVEIGRTGLPAILSTGMATLPEIELSLGALAFGLTRKGNPCLAAFRESFLSEEGRRALRPIVMVLQCTTQYPTPPKEANLLAMVGLHEALGLPVGLSDHTLGIEAPVAAAALGAEVVEKHFTLDRTLAGPDHRASMKPEELKTMVAAIRKTDLLLGTRAKIPLTAELENVSAVRKNLVAKRSIRKGERYSGENLTCKRSGGGVSAFLYFDYIGKEADKRYREDESINSLNNHSED